MARQDSKDSGKARPPSQGGVLRDPSTGRVVDLTKPPSQGGVIRDPISGKEISLPSGGFSTAAGVMSRESPFTRSLSQESSTSTGEGPARGSPVINKPAAPGPIGPAGAPGPAPGPPPAMAGPGPGQPRPAAGRGRGASPANLPPQPQPDPPPQQEREWILYSCHFDSTQAKFTSTTFCIKFKQSVPVYTDGALCNADMSRVSRLNTR